MQYIDHGDWVYYKPSEQSIPVLGGMSVQFCKRTSDDRDWYEFQQKELLANTSSIKLTLRRVADRWLVMSTATDASMLFPANTKLIEIVGDDKPHQELRGQDFDLATGEFTKLPPPEPPAMKQ